MLEFYFIRLSEMRFLQLNKTNLNLRAVKNVSFAYEYVINSDDRKSYLNKSIVWNVL
jgi:hypothetical protein